MTQFPILIPDPITSAANAEVKFLRSLHERKYRKKSGWFLAEGARICHEAVALGWNMHRLAFLAGRETDTAMRQLLDELAASGGRALPMTESLLQRISRKDNPQVLIGAFGQRWHVLQEVSETSDSIWVALDRVRDPGNLGTVMRTADAVGAAGIILVGACTDPYSVEAVRASMGAVFNVKITICSEAEFITFGIRCVSGLCSSPKSPSSSAPAALKYLRHTTSKGNSIDKSFSKFSTSNLFLP